MTTGNRPLRVDLVADMRRRCGVDDPKPKANAGAGETDGPLLITGEEIRRITESDRRMRAVRHAAPQSRSQVDLAADMRQRFDPDKAQPVPGPAEARPTGLRVDLAEDMRRRLAAREWPPADG